MNPNRVVLMLILVSGLISLATKSRGEKCPDHCGNLSIPFPFGTSEGCYLDENFLITCNHTTNTATLGNLPVLYISVPDGQLTVSFFAAADCYDESGNQTHSNDPWFSSESYHVSSTRNKFIAIGCDTYVYVQGRSINGFSAGCLSLCTNVSSVANGSCSGIGCCETSIPNGVTNFDLKARSFDDHNYTMPFNPCSYAFIVKDGEYNFSISDLSESFDPPDTYREFPMVLDWAIGNETCAQARKNQTAFACKNNSFCIDSVHGRGYICNCSEGYSGNPYIANGCQDIDECMHPDLNQCISKKHCRNTVGNYICFCPLGMRGDGKGACDATHLVILVAGISTSLGFMIFIGMLYVLRKYVKKKKRQGLKKKYFAKNGGLLLERQISPHNGELAKTRIFTSEELEKATEFYNKSRILGKGGQGTVYKGMLSDGTIVAVKKPVKMEEGLIEEFINEMVILSQINHKHVVKLLGCCLETQVPIVLYEYISSGTLSSHIHDPKEDLPLQWTDRLRIANEVAGALVYMHSAISTPIYHRDIKSSNILLDEKLRAKVSDFGISRYVPLEKTHLTTLVKGTFGYLDPEYFQSSQFTDKSDVYSYGVVLVELLMGQKPLSATVIEENRGLAAQFLLAMEENCLFDVLDPQVMEEAKKEQLLVFAHVAKSCLELTGRKRPTMSEVAMELENLKKMGKEILLPMRESQEDNSFLEASNRWGDSPIDTTEIVEDNEMELVVGKISDDHNTM